MYRYVFKSSQGCLKCNFLCAPGRTYSHCHVYIFFTCVFFINSFLNICSLMWYLRACSLRSMIATLFKQGRTHRCVTIILDFYIFNSFVSLCYFFTFELLYFLNYFSFFALFDLFFWATFLLITLPLCVNNKIGCVAF